MKRNKSGMGINEYDLKLMEGGRGYSCSPSSPLYEGRTLTYIVIFTYTVIFRLCTQTVTSWALLYCCSVVFFVIPLTFTHITDVHTSPSYYSILLSTNYTASHSSTSSLDFRPGFGTPTSTAGIALNTGAGAPNRGRGNSREAFNAMLVMSPSTTRKRRNSTGWKSLMSTLAVY